FRTLRPKEFYDRFIAENIRPDRRTFKQFRKTTVNVGSITTANGSALVKIGNTTMLCGIKTEFAVPKLDSPDHGYIVPNVDLPPLCSYRFRPGPPGEQAQVCSQYLADIIKSCNLINLKDLCIVKEKLAWVIYIDLLCLDCDGNVLDASVIAMLAALRSAKFPKVEIDEEVDKPIVSKDESFSLNVNDCPISSTFVLFDKNLILADPTSEEENLSSGYLTITVNNDDGLSNVLKPGGRGVNDAELNECITLAIKRARDMRDLLSKLC
ncbi:uncharacterized protein TRIADDRAFT_25085, partial [Trichoplax adhaerens]